VGKTKFAWACSAEYGSALIYAHGSESIAELIAKCRDAKAGDFLFVDEAQSLATAAQELLYTVIDEQRVPKVGEESAESSDASSFIEIEPCTVVLATDTPGRLRNALRKRMELDIRLDYYSSREMRAIVDRIAADLNLLLSPQASNAIARVSGGIPRKAKHYLQILRRHILDAEDRQIAITDVRRFLRAWGIDDKGLSKVDRRYLRFLLNEGKASLAALAAHLGTDEEDVAREIEPTLRRLGFIKIDAGRRLTTAGHEWIEAAGRSSQSENCNHGEHQGGHAAD
jgi:Holliday junction DNA helicase RuvB